MTKADLRGVVDVLRDLAADRSRDIFPRPVVDRAIRTALGDRRVTAIILPNDLQEMEYREPPRAHGTLHSGVGYARPRTVPYDADLQRAADALNAGKKVAIRIPAGTPTGKRFRVRGHGIDKDGQKGDLIVEVEVQVPEKLTEESEKAMREFAEASGLKY